MNCYVCYLTKLLLRSYSIQVKWKFSISNRICTTKVNGSWDITFLTNRWHNTRLSTNLKNQDFWEVMLCCCCEYFLTFQRLYNPLKYQGLPTQKRITSQKPWIFSYTIVRTSNLASKKICHLQLQVCYHNITANNRRSW